MANKYLLTYLPVCLLKKFLQQVINVPLRNVSPFLTSFSEGMLSTFNFLVFNRCKRESPPISILRDFSAVPENQQAQNLQMMGNFATWDWVEMRPQS